MTPQQLLQAYLAADKVRRETNGSWGPQWGMHNELNAMGYWIDGGRLEKRKGYWGRLQRWDGDVIMQD